MMWRFPVTVESGAEVEYTWDEVTFGDGYTQVAERGINSEQVQYRARTECDWKTGEEIVRFLRAHRDGRPFDFFDPVLGLLHFRCKRYRMQHGTGPRSTFDMEWSRAFGVV